MHSPTNPMNSPLFSHTTTTGSSTSPLPHHHHHHHLHHHLHSTSTTGTDGTSATKSITSPTAASINHQRNRVAAGGSVGDGRSHDDSKLTDTSAKIRMRRRQSFEAPPTHSSDTSTLVPPSGYVHLLPPWM
mmetsp:Transcript_20122/g.33664  ORF Transcript_20122/g.33664 Transcript_20122/m.33664 type:complete len:131 (-) Transcript_20122:157-549(-)